MSKLILPTVKENLSKEEQDAIKDLIEKNPYVNDATVRILAEKFPIFTFEAIIRPMDNALVIHLKNLRPKLRNKKFFEYATIYFRDRIGQYSSLDSSFIGEPIKGSPLNSLDMIFTKYVPAVRKDYEFIKTHTFKIATSFNDLIISSLDANAN